MLKPRDRQVGFYDADYVCEQLIPSDSFYRKFREIVEPLIEDEQFETMYCEDNGRPVISPALLVGRLGVKGKLYILLNYESQRGKSQQSTG